MLEHDQRSILSGEVSREVMRTLRANILAAESLKTYAYWYLTTLEFYTQGAEIQLGRPATAEDVIRQLRQNKNRLYTAEFAATIAEGASFRMDEYDDRFYNVFTGFRSQTHIRVALRQFYAHRAVFAILPPGTRMPDWYIDFDRTRDTTKNPDEIVFLPQTSCSEDAWDRLRKKHGHDPFFIPNRTIQHALKKIDYGSAGKEKTVNFIDAENPVAYLTVGLLGGFNNELQLVRVSGFWNRNVDEEESIAPEV